MNDRALEDPVEDVDSLTQDHTKLSDHFLTTRPLMISFISPNNEKPEERRDCLLEITFEDEEDRYYQSGYFENGKWYKWNGCGIVVSGHEFVSGWRYTTVC